MFTHTKNIYGKFHLNLSTGERDITPHEVDINGQIMTDGRTDNRKT